MPGQRHAGLRWVGLSGGDPAYYVCLFAVELLDSGALSHISVRTICV